MKFYEKKPITCLKSTFLILLVFIAMGIFTGIVTAESMMFRANPEHTGVYSDGGTLPTNTLKWSFQTGGNVFSSPAIIDGIVYFGSADDNVYAVAAENGTLVWKYTTGGDVSSSPAVSDGIVYIGSDDKKIYALDSSTGAVVWSANAGSNGWVKSSPTVVDGNVYVGMYGGSLYYRICAFNSTMGTPLWNYTSGGSIDSSPAVANGILYMGCGDNKVYALNATTGTLLWDYITDGRILSSPAVAEDKVYVGTSGITGLSGKIYALDSSTGERVWNYDIGDSVLASPAVANGIVYIGSNNHNVYALDADTGELVWSYTTTGRISSSPAVSNNTVYIGTSDGKLYAFDARTGAHTWHCLIGISSSPVITDGIVYIGSTDGKLYALGGPETPSTGPVHNSNLGTNYANISLAIKDAELNDTIVIDSGIYNDFVYIDKPLILIGQDTGAGFPVIDAASGSTGVRLAADRVTVKNIIVQNSNGASNDAGILISSDYNTIEDCVVLDSGNGILIASGSSDIPVDNTIKNCTISRNGYGMFLLGDNTTLINNTITENHDSGLLFCESRGTLKDNKLFANFNPEDDNGGSNLDITSLSAQDLDLDIDTSNLVEGKPLYFLNGFQDLIIDADDNPGALYCLNGINVTIRDLHIERNSNNIYLWNTTDIRIENTTVRKGWTGISLETCANVSIYNLTSVENEGSGIESSDSPDIVVENSTLRNIDVMGCDRIVIINNTFVDDPESDNSDSGITISETHDILVTNNSISHKMMYGLNLINCDGIVSNNHLFNNNGYGVYIWGGEYYGELLISENLIENNQYGVYLEECQNNRIENNSILNSEYAGLSIVTDYQNIFVNNYLSNYQNIEVISENPQITWNVDPTPGPNIVGGPSIGGNYWGSPDKSGFSDTAEDSDGDGFADSSYEIDSENVDNYPLVIFSEPPAPEALTADFAIHVMPTSSYPAFTVQYTDQSVDPDDSILSWAWDFGDGGTSSDQNPVHQYESPGSYLMTLEVINSSGISDSIQRAVQITDYIQVTDDSASQRNPAIDGDLIVWDSYYDNLDSNSISLYRISEDSTTQISSPESKPFIPDISGDKVVWIDSRNMDTTHLDIYLYSITSEEEIGICTEYGEQSIPIISGDYVCWGFHDYPIDELYLHQISTQETIQITGTIPWWESPFAIDGDYVVYLDNADGDADLYLYTISTGISTPIRTGIGDHWRPEISGDRVVFEFNEDIYLYNITTAETSIICNTPEYQRYPHIDGDTIVWFDGRNSASNAVYSYDLPTQTETVLFNDDSTRLDLDLSGNTIAWSQYDGTDWEVCYYQFGEELSENQPPVVDFTYSPESPLLYDTIQFTDASTDTDGSIVAWEWNIATTYEGTITFTDRDIEYQFMAPGPQTVTLTVTDNQGMTSQSEVEISVTSDASLSTADFFTIPLYPEVNDEVRCKMNNTIAFAEYGEIIERCSWQVDDINGNPLEYSEDFDPIFYFEPAGDYLVTLTIWDYWAASEFTPPATITKTIHVYEVGSQPVADFSADVTSGIAPLQVRFFDGSHGSTTDWEWNFGDGSPNLSGRFPVHAYTEPGTYTVSLTVTRDEGTYTTTKENYIRVWTEFPVNESPYVDWDYEFPSMIFSGYPTPGETIDFYDDSWDVEDEITDWAWDFGDGTTSTLQNPTHQYAVSGTYVVNLTVTDSYGSIGWYEEEFIVNYPPSVEFTMDPTPPFMAGDTITFTGTISDLDGDEIQQSSWFIEGEETSEEFLVDGPLTYTFPTPGLYVVVLEAVDSVGGETFVIWPLVVNDPAMTTYCMLVPGMTVADQQLALSTNITSQYLVNDVVTIVDDDVIVSMNGLTTTIHTDGLQDVDGNGILTGTVTSGTITSDPLVSESLSPSPVQASFTANLAPDSFLGDFVSAAIITANLNDTASTDVQSAYELAAVNASLDIVDVAYAFNIIGASMLNGIDVLNAEIVMTAPASWVDVQGGPEAVRIFRYSEYDGTTEILTPTWNLDAGTYTFTATSLHGLSVFGLVGVRSQAPEMGKIVVPIDPISLGSPVSVSAMFTDSSDEETHTALWNWGDGTDTLGVVDQTTRTVTGTHTYSSSGIYVITLTVTDTGESASSVIADQYIVIYDPSGGFVTGGGWIMSPEGAYTPDPTMTGKATFGFVSKYKKGATVPTGETEFQFKAGNLNFRSTSYDWLVVAGAKAMYKGTGTINSAGEYGFMLTAIDGAIKGGGGTDKFRIKIWEKATEALVYDNQLNAPDTDEPTTVISGGSIVIHTK